MAIVVEDGTFVEDANSYISADDVRVYASDRGIALPAIVNGSDPIIPWMILAMDYLESLCYILVRARSTQALDWPRGFSCNSGDYMLPKALAKAQAQLVIEQFNGIVLMPTVAGGQQFITREKVDVIETSYSEVLGTLSTPTMSMVDALLRNLTVGTTLRTVRV